MDGYEALKDIPVGAMQVYVDGTEVAVTMENLVCQAYENKDDAGNVTESGYQILLYNAYDGNAEAVEAIAAITSTLKVVFTLGEVTTPEPEPQTELTADNVTLEYATVEYDGSAKTPAVTVKDGETALVENTDYTLAYANNTEAGTATVTVTGMGNYTGTVVKEFTITEAAAPATEFKAYLGYSDADWWPGTSGDVSTTVTGEGTYTLEWDVPGTSWGSTAAGTNTFYINIVNGYEALKDIPVGAMQVFVDGTEVAVTLSNLVCAAYENKDDAGNVTESGYQILLYNAYSGGAQAIEAIEAINSTLKVVFVLGEVAAPEIELTADGVTLEYDTVEDDGTAKTPAVTVMDGETLLVENTDYTLTYANNDAEGTATVTVTGMGNYFGTVVKEFTITKSSVERHKSYLGYGDQEWGSFINGDEVKTSITGEGVYTLEWNPATAATGTSVFYINIKDGWEKYRNYNVTNLQVLVDGVAIPVNMGNLKCDRYVNSDDAGNVTESGYQILLYNRYWLETSYAVNPIETINESLVVTFTLAEKPDTSDDDSDDDDADASNAAAGSTAVGSTYTAKMAFYDADWWPGGEVTTMVDPNGTYTLDLNLLEWENVNGVVVFYIDIIGAADKVHLTDLSIVADGNNIPVDLTKVATGDLEGKGNYRIEIFNEYGTTKNNSPIDTGIAFNNKMSVTFTLAEGSGEAALANANKFTGEGYETIMVFNDADWWPQASVTTGVTGAGTYTMSWDVPAGETAEGIVTFYIDMLNAAAAFRSLSVTDLTILVDGKEIPVDMSKILFGDLEGYGNYRIEIYNEYGITKDFSPIDPAIVVKDNLTVTFTLAEAVSEAVKEPAKEETVKKEETAEPAVKEETVKENTEPVAATGTEEIAEEKTSNALPIVGAIAGVGLLGGGGAVLFRRRKKVLKG